MKKKWQYFASLGALMLILVGYNQCIMQDQIQLESDASVYDLPTKTVDTSSMEATPTVAMKNFEQINLTMSELTGVSVTDNNVKNTYDTVKTLMPVDNNLETFLSKDQISITRLAGTYCDRLVENSNLRQAIWPNIDFGQNVNTVFANDSTKLYVIDQAISKFWGEGVQTGQSLSQARTDLFEMFEMLRANESNNSATTRNLVKGVCIATLSSANVILL
ncbi:MAG: hypothetical protein JNM93_12765 [Bacteriovoracaceae bacterium]|nr:hypothetical protein [Bacteriovoracaceae bacterium]